MSAADIPKQDRRSAADMARGHAVAREYARWHLGSASWADRILRAYFDPTTVAAELTAEKES